MKRKSEMSDFNVGDRVRLIAETLAWKAEMKLHPKETAPASLGELGPLGERQSCIRT
jgi:hypothetical protein